MPARRSWYHLLGVLAYCDVDGDALAQQWSAEHKNYTPKETAEKLARQRKETSGPTTCATLERLHPPGCQGCPYQGTVTTPVQLGRFSAKDAAPPLSFVSNAKAADWGEPDLSLLELRRRPPPTFPLALLNPFWAEWVAAGAVASAAPIDYVALPLKVEHSPQGSSRPITSPLERTMPEATWSTTSSSSPPGRPR
jgi:hypothetical protein